MWQILHGMEMINPTIGWRRDEQGTHAHAHGSWILWSVSRVRSKTMHSLSCITSWLPYITLCYLDWRFFLPREQSRTAPLGCSLAINITRQQHHNRFSSKSNFNIFFGNAFHYRYFGCLSSAMWSFTKMYTRNFKISLNFYKKGIHFAWTEDRTWCRQICYFLDVSEKFLSLTCFSNDLYTLYKWLNASRLVRFWKTWKHVNQGINTALSSFNNCNLWGFFHRNSD